MDQMPMNETNETIFQDEQREGIHITINRKEALTFLAGGAVIAFFYTVCFSGIEILPQLSFSLFCPAAFVILTFVLKYLSLLKNNKAILWAIPITVIAAFNGIFSMNLFTYGNVLVMHVLFAVYVISAMQQQPMELFDLTGLKKVLCTIIGNWGVFINVYQALRLNRQDDNKAKTVKKVLLGVLIAFPVLFIIISLLISADMVFGRLIQNVFKVIMIDFINIPFIVSFIIVWIYTIGYVYQSKKISEDKKQVAFPCPKADIVVSATFLVLVNLVFLMFSVVQVTYLFSGGFMTLPKGMVYSQYAREGFFQLLLVTVINFSVIIVFMCVLKGVRNSKLLRYLLLMLCCFTGILIISSFYRMFLYIDIYGHTTLRLMVITFLVMEVFLICITVGKLFVDKVPFIKWFAITGLVFYLVVNVTGSEYFATKLNVNLFLSGKLSSVDVSSIGADGYYVVKPLMESNQYICIDYSIKKKSEAKEDSFDNVQTKDDIFVSNRPASAHWQNWSYFNPIQLRSTNLLAE